jgi:hypothetical protein
VHGLTRHGATYLLERNSQRRFAIAKVYEAALAPAVIHSGAGLDEDVQTNDGRSTTNKSASCI